MFWGKEAAAMRLAPKTWQTMILAAAGPSHRTTIIFDRGVQRKDALAVELSIASKSRANTMKYR